MKTLILLLIPCLVCGMSVPSGVAQGSEHEADNLGVDGSIPSATTYFGGAQAITPVQVDPTGILMMSKEDQIIFWTLMAIMTVWVMSTNGDV